MRAGHDHIEGLGQKNHVVLRTFFQLVMTPELILLRQRGSQIFVGADLRSCGSMSTNI